MNVFSGHNLRVRSERHSVCVTDLPKLKSSGSSMPSNDLFVDSKLANVAVINVNNQWHGLSNAVEMRSSMWNLSVSLNSQSLPLHLIFLICNWWWLD